jgi:hypothetical protein
MKPKSIERLSPSNAMYLAIILAHKFISIHTDAIPLQKNGVPGNKRSKPNKQHIGSTVVIIDKIVKLTSWCDLSKFGSELDLF